MPLHGKIVVIKRSGGDGTEFPLTATCLFGRKPDCDIRIQLPQVSKEHCKIDLNENKEVILTNLSSVNPTRVNGEVLQQSERLKHGDVITIIDRSFRFEYPPAPTPKKRSSTGGKVLQDQQVGDTILVESDEKSISEVSTDPHLKDGANHDNIQRSLEKTMEMESKEDESLLQNKTTSPFSDLYQMIKKSLDVNTPRKSSASLIQTPTSRFCTPKPVSVRKNVGKPVISTGDKSTPKKDEVKVSSGADESKVQADSLSNGTPKSAKKQRKSFQVPTTEMAGSAFEDEYSAKSATSPQRRNRATPQRFTVCEVIEQISAERPKSPLRRSKEVTPAEPALTKEQEDRGRTPSKNESFQKVSPGNLGKVEKVKEMSKKRKSGELAADLPTSQMKRKRVSFGGYLSPELFDKRLPPDSPLRKGASPRRSLCLAKPKQSLLRRASVIGSLKEFQRNANMRTPSPKKSSVAKNASPKTLKHGNKSPKSKSTSPAKKSPTSKTPSPKATSPGKKSQTSKTLSPKATSPGKKSPKSKTPSPKATAPGRKSPKSKTPSPKATAPGKKSPKSKTPSPKASSPGKSPKSMTPLPQFNERPKTQSKTTTPTCKNTPSGRRRSSMTGPVTPESAPTAGVTPARTPLSSIQTPVVQGRFSVSRISTPSPVAEDAVSDNMPSIAVTPKIPLRRKSMKSTSRKTQSVIKSTVKAMHRRSGISRASMKVINSWADIVKFGQTKTQVAAPAKKKISKKATKKNVSKPQTPARKLQDHVSTGHADSPVTIVVGRAYKQKVVHPAGAAPRVVTNIALLRKDMKMDEDLTGISEMFKTPVNEKKRSSAKNDNVTRTPVGSLGISMMEPSVLATPEEPGEMMVSPLNDASTVKGRIYNSEAVQRLLNVAQDSSFVGDVTTLEIHSDCSEQQSTDLKTTTVTSPKHKPEPVECLIGVKRIMRTPRHKAEPVEDIRGKLLVTPKQKPPQQECLTGVKRLMKTPKEKAEAVEDLRGKLLVTPKRKPQQPECLTGVKRIMKTPTSLEADHVSLDGVKDLLQTPAHLQESRELSKTEDMKTPVMKRSPSVGITRIVKTPKEKSAPVEDMVGVKRLMKTPREKGKPVENNFGIKRLMKSPRLRGSAPVEDFEGLKELMEDSTRHMETNEVEDQTPDFGVSIAKETEVVDDHMEELPNGHLAAVDVDSPIEKPKVDTVDNVSEEQLEVQHATGKVTEINTTTTDNDHEKKSLRGRRAKVAEPKAAEDKQEATENSDFFPAPARGRRGKKAETTAPLTARQATRNRSKDVELTVEESAPQPSKVALKPKRGRNTKKVSEDQAKVQEVQDIAAGTEAVPEAEGAQCPSVKVGSAPLEKAVPKPRRGRKTKTEQSQSALEQQDVSCTRNDDVPQADMAEDANEVCCDQLEVVPSENFENKLTEVMETAQAPVTQSLPQVEAETCNEADVAVVQKKSVRGRRVKTVESIVAENEHSQDPAISAPVRGRRGKKTEATAPPTVRQTRIRNAKTQESTFNQTEAVQEQAVETTLVAEIAAEAVSDQTSAVNTSQEENYSAPPVEEVLVKPVKGRKTKTPAEPPQPEKNMSDQHLVADTQQPISTVGKPRRGRKAQRDVVEPKEVSEDTVVTVETMQPVGRAKRGRNAKHEENDDKTTLIETTKSEDPVKQMRTRKTEQDHIEPREEIQAAEIVVQQVSEPEWSTVAAKPRRGGRKTKQEIKSEIAVESIEVQEVPAVSSTDKPKRGMRGKRVVEEAQVPQKNPDHELEAEQETAAELDPVIKPSRVRGVKTEVSQIVPAKRARRGAALPHEESNAESALTSVEPVKRGRRPAKRPTTDNTGVSTDQENPSEELGGAVEDSTKTSKRSVKWKADLEVFEIPKATPVKAVRGRKSKAGNKVEAESKNVSKDVNKTEEKALSDQTVEAQPIKRARRGAKIADELESSIKEDPSKGAEAETQPKTRRGRSAKK